MSRSDFIEVASDLLRDSCNGIWVHLQNFHETLINIVENITGMDDVKAAFRVFDHNNDGTISKEELMEAMLNFGTRFTEE